MIRLYLALGLAALAGIVLWQVNDRAWDRGFAAHKALVDAATIEGQAATIGQQDASAAATAEAGNEAATRGRETDIVFDDIQLGVSAHVDPDTDLSFPVPWGLVCLHDAAARAAGLAEVSACTARPAAAASAVTASHLARTVAGNYRTCHGFRNDLTHWSSWYLRQQQSWDAFAARINEGEAK